MYSQMSVFAFLKSHQDNAPCHSAKILQEWFEKHNKEFKVLTWPLSSPNLKPFEHLRDVPDKKRRIHAQIIRLQESDANVLDTHYLY